MIGTHMLNFLTSFTELWFFHKQSKGVSVKHGGGTCNTCKWAVKQQVMEDKHEYGGG